MYKYKVNYYCSYDDQEKLDVGIVAAQTYAEAATKLVEAWGEDLIDIYLLPLDVDDCKDVISWDDIKLSFEEECVTA